MQLFGNSYSNINSHPKIVELCEKYKLKNFKKYIDINNYTLLSENGKTKFYKNNENSNLILRVIKIQYRKETIFRLLYSKNGDINEKLEYYKNIPNRFIVDSDLNRIKIIEWFIDDYTRYNNDGPCAIRYFSDENICNLSWNNKQGIMSNVEFPSYIYRFNSDEAFKYCYKINGNRINRVDLEIMIEKIRDGKIKKNINRYSNVNKLKIFKEIAEYYNLEETIEAIENRFLILKLENKI